MGACLARNGASVTMIVRPQSLAAYPEQLRLESPFGSFSVPVARASEVPPTDVLWVTVKATQLPAALEAITNPASIKAIVPLLNGVNHLAFLRTKYGAERVIAATDCGLGGRVHPMVAWAKLEALAQGAALASRELWR